MTFVTKGDPPAGEKSIGMGHQYAFDHDIPIAGDNFATRFIMRSFAPGKISPGVHWHHFNNSILPSLIEPTQLETVYLANKILVYMPFDETKDIVDWLGAVEGYDFYIYCSATSSLDEGNIHLRPFSRHGFLADLASCSGIISNAGFELLSEAIQGGRKLLVQPLRGQMEQISNALALEKLGYGDVMHQHDTPIRDPTRM